MNKQTYRAGCTASKGGRGHSLIRKSVATHAHARNAEDNKCNENRYIVGGGSSIMTVIL